MIVLSPARGWRALAVTAAAGILGGCTPVTDVPYMVEDLEGTYRVQGRYETLVAVDDSLLCQGSNCVSQVAIGEFVDVGDGRQCTVSIGGVSLELRANGTFQLDGTRRLDCADSPSAMVTTSRESLTAVGLYRLHDARSGRLSLLQSDGESGTYPLEGWVEGVESITGSGQIIPRLVHFGVRDASRLEFTTTWTH